LSGAFNCAVDYDVPNQAGTSLQSANHPIMYHEKKWRPR
jgi:hypothetical protein